jgi:hypothetical protein
MVSLPLTRQTPHEDKTMMTDWGKRAIELEAMTKRELASELATYQDDMCIFSVRCWPKYRIIGAISRATADLYDDNGMLKAVQS